MTVDPEKLPTPIQQVDSTFFIIFAITIIMLIGIVATTIYFVVKYRRQKYPRPTATKNYSILLETIWTVVPSVIVILMFYYGWVSYKTLRNVPEHALQVKVTGHQWSWSFEYTNGKTSNKLYVPVGKPVKVRITSTDVIHSFYIPAFRVKRDAVPGMETYVWFSPAKTGSYDIFCAEYCGVGHSSMITTVEVLPEREFQEWLQKGEEPEEKEAVALLRKYGCLGCHSLDGTKKIGPTLYNLASRAVSVVITGKKQTIRVDEEYLKRSILDPGADIVEGYPPVMPSFKGIIPDKELDVIVDYLETLK